MDGMLTTDNGTLPFLISKEGVITRGGTNFLDFVYWGEGTNSWGWVEKLKIYIDWGVVINWGRCSTVIFFLLVRMGLSRKGIGRRVV